MSVVGKGPDASDMRENKLRHGIDRVEKQLNDRWPARGKANTRGGEWRPYDDVSREGRTEPYRKYPQGRS